MQLTKTQRNEVFDAVVAGAVDPAACDITFRNSSFIIEHRPTESEFFAHFDDYVGWSFRSKAGERSQRLSPTGMNWHVLPEGVEAWARAVALEPVKTWAKAAADWTERPDLWELSREARNIPGEQVPDSANTRFTAGEQAAISAQLKEIAESIKKTYELTAAQSTEVDKKFEEAEKASQRMGRKDWGLLFGGAIFALILADAITPGVAGHILMMTEHAIGHLFSGPPVGGTLTAG